jgi:hypothetical protein
MKNKLIRTLLIINLPILLVLNSCYTMFEALTNNLNGIEKSLKDVYIFNEEDKRYRTTPHHSDVVSVTVALDKYYTFSELILDVNLTNNRNFIIRDDNGRLKNMKIQKFGDYALNAYYYNPNLKESERYSDTFQGVRLIHFNRATGLEIKNLKEMIDNYDSIYARINNLPEIIKENNQYTIYYNNEIYVINDTNDHTTYINEMLNINDQIVFTTNRGEKILVFKRRWTESDASNNLRRISG